MKDLETRTYSVNFEARDEGEEAIVTGRPIVYDSKTDLGWFDEIIAPNALYGADLSDVRLCLNHDTSYVYARSRRNNPKSTMNLTPNEYGLDIEAKLAVDKSPKARDFYTAIQRGDIDKMSFMFSVEKDEWEDLDTDHPLRRITKIGSVVEVSAVTFPAYDTTDIQARSKEALENARSALEKAKAATVDTGELDLLKEKTKILGGK